MPTHSQFAALARSHRWYPNMPPRRGANALHVFLLACRVFGASAEVYYLDQSAGDDANDGLALDSAFKTAKVAVKSLRPGDELQIVGQLANPSYDPTYRFGDVSDAQLWHGENALTISDVHGSANGWITITSHDTSSVLKSDGSNVVRVQKSSYIRLRNLHIQGEVENIPLSTAKAVQFVYRDANGEIKHRVDPNLTPDQINELQLDILGSNVPRVSYTDTRGVYVSDSHHIELSGSHIHHMPGGGIRFAGSEYQTIFDNEVDNCARKSYSGTHALVVTYATDNLPREAPAGAEDYRAIIVRNKVHHNYNEIFSWVGTKPFVHAKIDEGKGISLQRNQKFKNGGRILVANNIAYWNGYSGVHSQDGDNVDFFSNTVFMNSYTNTRGEYKDDGSARSGNNIGISMQGGKNCRVVNNIAYIDTSWKGMPISISNLKEDKVGRNNLVFGKGTQQLKTDEDFGAFATGTVEADPKFSDTTTFRLAAGSPAVGGAAVPWSPCEDFYGNKRSHTKPSIGAVEANCEDGACEDTVSKAVEPNDLVACYAPDRDDEDNHDDYNPADSEGKSDDKQNSSYDEDGELDKEHNAGDEKDDEPNKETAKAERREQAEAERKRKAKERQQERQKARNQAKAERKRKAEERQQERQRLRRNKNRDDRAPSEGLSQASLGASKDATGASLVVRVGPAAIFLVLCVIAVHTVFTTRRSYERSRPTSQSLLDPRNTGVGLTQNYGAGI